MFHSRIYHVLCISVSFFSSFSNIFLLVSIIHSKAKSEMSLNLSLKQKSCSKKRSRNSKFKKTLLGSAFETYLFFYSLFPHDLNLTPIWLRPLTTKRLYEWNPYVWFTGPIITIAFIKVLQKPCLKCPSKCVWVEFDCLDNLLISSILF